MNSSIVGKLAYELMSVDSTSGNEGEVIALTEDLLLQQLWEVTRIPVSPGRDAIFAKSSADVSVTLSTHLDTVPPYIPPTIDGDVLRGRGACDAKGIAASMMLAAHELRDRGAEVGLLFVIGEETTHDGAHAANQWIEANLPRRKRALINGEPTESRLALGTKGALRVIVRASGKAAHSAYPSMGHSAIHALVAMLAELPGISWPTDPMLGETTVNIGGISGGVADNVFAPAAEARLMIRLVGPVEDVQRILERWADGRATLEWGVSVPAIRLTAIPGFETTVAAYATDIPALSNWGRPLLFGPGSIHVAHTAEEWVQISEMQKAVATYVEIATALINPRV